LTAITFGDVAELAKQPITVFALEGRWLMVTR